jgi:hypothetical protein
LDKPLETDGYFTPCPVGAGDELFPNGIFVFNITKIIDLAMAECNPNAVRRLVIAAVAMDRCRGGVVVTGARDDVELADHVLSDDGL